MEKKKSWFSKLKEGLGKTGSWFAGLFGAERIDDAFYDELEEAMILADMGMDTAEKLLDEVKTAVRRDKLTARDEAKTALVGLIADTVRHDTDFLADNGPCAVLIVGVNGVGKTTTIGKLAHLYKEAGRKPMIAAADTFHAIASYKAKGCDLLLVDTAGRLHNKKNLMNELSKIRRVIAREMPDIPCEVLLVLDATTGQNATAQAKAFMEVCDLTGVVLTKLDGTAKGGVTVQIHDTLRVPVRFIGVGEGIDDLQRFDADEFAKALL